MHSLTVAAKIVQGTLSLCPQHPRLGCTKCGVIGETGTVYFASMLKAADCVDLHQFA